MLAQVDEFVVVGNAAGVSHAKGTVKILFEVTDFDAVSVFLDVVRDRSARKLLLVQPRDVQSMLEQFSMKDCKSRLSPLHTELQLTTVVIFSTL
jgi:hypothetical protein